MDGRFLTRLYSRLLALIREKWSHGGVSLNIQCSVSLYNMLLNIYLFKLVLTSLKLFLSVFRYTEIYAEFKGKFNFYKSLPTY